jgi:hypothetical protein
MKFSELVERLNPRSLENASKENKKAHEQLQAQLIPVKGLDKVANLIKVGCRASNRTS